MHTTQGMCLCHYTISMCSGRFVKGRRRRRCDSKCKSLGTITTFKCCVLLSVQYLTAPASHSLYCSKIDMLMRKSSWTTLVSENRSKTVTKPSGRHILYQTPALCVCVCVQLWKREEEKSLGLPWPTSSPSPLYSLFLCGAVSLPGVGSAPPQQVGRVYQSTRFNFLRLCRLALFSFSLCCAGSPGPWVGESLWVLVSGSGLLKKKMQVIYWEKWRSLSN